VSEFERLLRSHLGGRVALSAGQVGALERHYDLLVRWNRVLNLTAIRTMEEAVVRHYCECLYFAALLPTGPRVLDYGSGAGFPGIPIAIVKPEFRVALAESHQRKAVFLREATRGMSNISVLPQRAEDLTESFDLVVSRAVDPAQVLGQIPRLAPCAGFLAGGSSLQPAEASQAAWSERVKLPWGDDRWAVFGRFHVQRS